MKRLLFSLALSISILQVSAQAPDGCSAKERYTSKLVHQQNRNHLKSTSDYDVHYYKLDLHLENNTTFIEGMGRLGVKSLTTLSNVEFELHSNFTIDSIIVSGVKQPYSRTSSVITVNLASSISPNTNFNIDVYYHGTAPSGGTAAIGDGFSTGSSPSWGNSVTWSLSEPYAAYEWFPVKQVLQDKADSSEVWVTTDAGNMVGSNGVLENVTNMPNSKKRYEWKSRYPIAYYLISVAVAQYVDYTIYAKPAGITDSIKIVNFIYNNPQTLPNFKTEIDKTADMIEVFSEKFGLYPFHKEKYGHCMAPFSGGMEHQTMTSQGFFFTDLTSHELGHQWFGDEVTCASWRDIWVNEGFASYSEFVYIENKEVIRKASWLNDTEASALASTTGSVYVNDTVNVGRIFSSSLSYNKGAFLLHMLRFEIDDDDLFFQGLRDYVQQYGGSNATGVDFKGVMENTTSMNFDTFFDQWYFGEGYPIYNINWNHDKLGNLDMIIDQIASASPATPLFEMSLEITINRLLLPDTTIRLFINKNSDSLIIPNVNGTIIDLTVDADNWVLNGPGSVLKNPTIDLGLSEEDRENVIQLFPNPTKDKTTLLFRAVQKDLQIDLVDVKGGSLQSWTFTNTNRVELNIEQGPGIYFLKINNGEESQALRLVVE